MEVEEEEEEEEAGGGFPPSASQISDRMRFTVLALASATRGTLVPGPTQSLPPTWPFSESERSWRGEYRE
jgi:hypothetical protein